jgi:hypothetical protein
MSIYLSAGYERKYEVRSLAAVLSARGLDVVSTWHDEEDADDDLEAPGAPWCAVKDLEEVRSADIFVALATGGPTRGGHHAEWGAAMALGQRLLLVGPREQHFHALPRVERCRTVRALVVYLWATSVCNNHTAPMAGAPWTDEQVLALNEYQACGHMEPYVVKDHDGQVVRLVASRHGWVGPSGGVLMIWAHARIADGSWRQGLGARL